MSNAVRSDDTPEYIKNKRPEPEEFSKNQAAVISKALELVHEKLRKTTVGDKSVTSSATTKAFCKLQIGLEEREMFGVLFLNNRHTLISFDILFMGTIDGASVHPREIIKKALEYNAAAMILTHNHPSGVSDPSNADKMITERIVQAANLMDIRVLDHIVVGMDCVSFSELGLL